MLGKELYILRCKESRKGIYGSLQVQKTSLLGLCFPFIRISVTIKDDSLMLLNGLLNQFVELIGKVLSTLEFIRKLL